MSKRAVSPPRYSRPDALRYFQMSQTLRKFSQIGQEKKNISSGAITVEIYLLLSYTRSVCHHCNDARLPDPPHPPVVVHSDIPGRAIHNKVLPHTQAYSPSHDLVLCAVDDGCPPALPCPPECEHCAGRSRPQAVDSERDRVKDLGGH